MWLPVALLALICVVLESMLRLCCSKAVYACFRNIRICPILESPSLVSSLVIVSILAGIIVYLSLNIKKFRTEDSFIGGERIQDRTQYPTTEFYKTLGEFRFLSTIYKKAEEKWFDIYDLCRSFVLWVSHLFSEAHTGVLSGYIILGFSQD